MIKKRLMAILIIFSMLLSLMPTIAPTAYAATSDVAEEDAFDALGIDTDKLPEGYDQNSSDNPYGRSQIVLNPVYELFEQSYSQVAPVLASNTEKCVEDGHSNCTLTTATSTTNYYLNSKLSGHNRPLKIYDDFLKNPTSLSTNVSNLVTVKTTHTSPIVNDETTNSNSIEGRMNLVSTISVGGNFSKDKDASPKGQVVTVGVDAFKHNAGLYMYFADAKIPTDESIGGYKSLIKPSDAANITGTIGNYDGVNDLENFGASKYLMTSYLKLAAGDFDNDGVDEVAVYVPARGNSRIEVYKLHAPAGASSNAYLVADNWKLEWAYYLQEGKYVSNMVSLTSGDLNHDGTDDLAITWGYYFSPTNMRDCRAMVLYGNRDGKMLQQSKEIPLSYERSKIVRAAFTYGDVDGDNVDDLILGGSLASDLESGNLNSRFCAVYSYNGDMDKFIQVAAKNFNLFEKSEGAFVNSGETDGKYYSLPILVANITTVDMEGMKSPSSIYLDSLIIDLEDQGLSLNAALDDNSGKQIFRDSRFVGIVSGSYYGYYIEYGANAGDFLGLGNERLQVMQYILPYTYKNNVHNIGIIFGMNWIVNWLELLDSIYSGTDNISAKHSHYDIEFTKGISSGSNSTTVTPKAIIADNKDFSYSYSLVNTDNDTSLLKYKNKHYLAYSDPKVLAVLASPPYFEDLSSSNLSGSYMESTTGYEKSTGTGNSEFVSHTLNIGAYVAGGYEGLIAKFETELAYQHGFTWESTTTSETEYTVGYGTVAGQDSVTLYSIPTAIYCYDAFIPKIDDNGIVTGYEESEIRIHIPYSPSVATLALDTYEDIAADYPELPQIANTVLTHTIGDPSTYPRSPVGYNKAIYDKDADWRRVEYGNASQRMNIEMDTETETAFNHTDTIDFKIGGGTKYVWGGITLGYEANYGKAKISTNGQEYSAEVYNMPMEAQPYGYSYLWKLFAYEYSDPTGRNNFPVVSYLVNEVVEPASLPKDLGIDVTNTTSTEMALTWSYQGNAAGFQLYRYYEFPVGSGSYELAFVGKANSYKYDEATNTYYYRYIDKGLMPYTQYQYQIQTIGNTLPSESILSDVYTFRTKTDVGYPIISVSSYPDTTSPVQLYPDEKTTVSVDVTMGDGGKYSEEPRYQWQKQVNGDWIDLTGKISNDIVFSASNQSSTGTYRCLVNVINKNPTSGLAEYISAFSEPIVLDYSKRTPKVVDFTVKDSDNDNQPELNIKLASSHDYHNAVPSGNVTFTISNENFSRDYKATLNENGVATIEIPDVLLEGTYEVNAHYQTTRIFKAIDAGPKYFRVGDTAAYVMSSPKDQYVYGQSLVPILNKLERLADGSASLTPMTDMNLFNYKVNYYNRMIDMSILSQFIPNYEYTDVSDKDVSSSVKVYDSSTDIITPYRTGRYTIEAYLEGSNDVIAKYNIFVYPKPISIKMNALKGNYPKGNNVVPSKVDMILTNNSTMVFGQTINDLSLQVLIENSAQKLINDNNYMANDALPGEYIMTPTTNTIRNKPSRTNPIVEYYHINDNYSYSFERESYIITGQKYFVSTAAEKLDNQVVGSILQITPDLSKDGYSDGTMMGFRAIPEPGYKVKEWVVTDTNKGNVIKTYTPADNNNYATSIIHKLDANDITVTVVFEKTGITFEYYVTPAGKGKIYSVDEKGQKQDWVSSGIKVNPSAKFNMKIEPELGYHFYRWEKVDGGTGVAHYTGTTALDGSNTQEIEIGERSVKLFAQLERDYYNLSIGENLSGHYYIKKDGKDIRIPVNSGDNKIPGDSEVTVYPSVGFVVDPESQWSVQGDNLSTANGTIDNNNYKLVLLSNTSISVKTINEKYSVSLTKSGNGALDSLVTSEIDGIETDDLTSVAGGSHVTFTAKPSHGYAFKHWIIDGVDSGKKDLVLDIASLGKSMDVVAVFDDNVPYDIAVNFNPTGTVLYSLNDGDFVELASGDIVPNVFKGDKVILKAVPHDELTMIRKWTIDGKVIEKQIPITKTFTDINANHNVEVTFGGKVAYTLEFGTNGNGTIDALLNVMGGGWNTLTSGDTVDGGSIIKFNAVPNTDYMIAEWLYNGEPILTDDGNLMLDESYTVNSFSSTSGSAIVYIPFTALVSHDIAVNSGNFTCAVDKYPEIANLDTNKIRDKAKASFTIKPNDGYRVVEVRLNDGKDIFDEQKTDIKTGITTCIVNSVQKDLNLEVIVAKEYNITYNTPGATIINSPIKAYEGEWVRLEINPNQAYSFDEVKVKDVNGELKLYSDNSDDSSKLLTPPVNKTEVWFKMPSADVEVITIHRVKHTVTATADNGGAITPSGNLCVLDGDNQVFSIQAYSGYTILDVLVDGTSIGAVGSYIFEKVANNHSIHATFKSTGNNNNGGNIGGGGTTVEKFVITVTAGIGGTISPSTDKFDKDSNVTYTIKANKNYEIKDVLIDGISVGAVSTYSFVKINKNHSIEALFKEVKSNFINPFKDVNENDWFYKAVEYMNSKGLMNGLTKDMFAPYTNTTRAMIVTILYRLSGSPNTVGTHTFKDVQKGSWYENAVIWAKNNNIVKGYDEFLFGPNDDITREQLIAILYRYAMSNGVDVSIKSDLTMFKDYNKVSDYAKEALGWAVNAGIINGYSDGTLNPLGCATRAEIATVFYNFSRMN